MFNKLIVPGQTNDDIARLQKLLNSDPDTRVASKGAGSPGNETKKFGPATTKALGKFQLKYHVVKNAKDSGYGKLGPKTRAKILEVFGGKTVPQNSPAPLSDQSKLQNQLDQLKALQVELQALQKKPQ